MSYTAKDITVLEGLEPVRKRPGMYIGGVGAAGLHHLVWEILDNSIDEAMNGHASTIAVTLHDDGSSVTITDDGRGIPVDVHAKTKKSAARGDLHGAPRRRQVRARQLQDRGRPARRRRQRRQRALARAGRHGEARRPAVGDALQAGQARRRPEEDGRGPWQRHHRLLQARPDDLPEGRVRTADHPRPARGRQLPAQGRQGHLRRPDHRHQADLPARRRAGRLPQEDPGRANGAPGARGAVLAGEGERPAPRGGAAVDRVHRRAPAQLRQRHPDRLGRHARERLPGRARQGRPQLHRDPQPLAQGRDPHRRRHPRGPHRRAVGVPGRAAVPGPDQGPAEQPRGDQRRRRPGASRARALAEPQHLDRRGDRRPHHPGGAGPRGQPRGAGRGRAQGPDRRPGQPAGQARRLHAPRRDHQRAVRGRRRLGRRLGQAGPRPGPPGDPAAARQGAQHRGHLDRQGAGEQGARRPRHRARLRRRQGLRPARACATAR